jgi:hypothetical protein
MRGAVRPHDDNRAVWASRVAGVRVWVVLASNTRPWPKAFGSLGAKMDNESGFVQTDRLAARRQKRQIAKVPGVRRIR